MRDHTIVALAAAALTLVPVAAGAQEADCAWVKRMMEHVYDLAPLRADGDPEYSRLRNPPRGGDCWVYDDAMICSWYYASSAAALAQWEQTATFVDGCFGPFAERDWSDDGDYEIQFDDRLAYVWADVEDPSVTISFEQR